MRIAAASSTAVAGAVRGPRRPARWLGGSPAALYLQTVSGDVIGILTRDAVKLPCALVINRSGFRLDRLFDASIAPWVGDGLVGWTEPTGAVTVIASGEWRPPMAPTGRPVERAITTVSTALNGHDIGIDIGSPLDPAALLGRGPGLTPSGDDVLAGALLGLRSFGCPDPQLDADVLRLAPKRTTALSAQLLRHAVAGECAPPVARLLAACVDPAAAAGEALTQTIEDVLRIGATSGAALAAGVVHAARRRLVTGAAA